MVKYFIVINFFIAINICKGQTYFKTIGGGFNGQPTNIAADSLHNKLYAFGTFTRTKITNIPVKFAAVWDGVKWDSIRHLVGDSVGYIVRLNNVMYTFDSQIRRLNPVTLTWDIIARANPGKSFGRLGLFGNDLIIFGNQDSINGIKVSQIVKFDGVNFTSLGSTNFIGNFTMCEYKNELYIGGGFYEYVNNLEDLAKWDGTKWINLPWISGGSFNAVADLIVYQNKLFVAGIFSKSTGQVADGLLSWDGQSIVDYNIVNSSVDCIADMCIYRDKLIMVGLMDTKIPLSNHQFTGFLSYDGNSMCSYVPYYNNTQSYKMLRVDVFQDSLVFFSSRLMSPTDTVNYICNYVGDFIPQYCQTGVGIEENKKDEGFTIYPNPTSSILYIKDEKNEWQSATITVTNSLGQTILQMPFSNSINVSELAKGYYLLSITTIDNRSLHSKFVKE